MVAVPGATGVTTPVLLLTVATAPLLLVQAPPAVPLVLRVAVLPMHSEELPVMVPAVTLTFTVTLIVASVGEPQPLDMLYLMVDVPAPIAVSSPDVASMVATAVLLLVQVPPVEPLVLRSTIPPIQRAVV